MLRKVAASFLVIGLSLMGLTVGTGAEAKPKSPIVLTAKAAVSVPVGSQDFQMVTSPQGANYVQWIVKAPAGNNAFSWQIWKGDYNPYEGVFINQTKIYELPAGKSFLATPVITRFHGTTGIVYSTVWDTGTELKSEVEAIVLSVENASERQVLSKFPTYSIQKSSEEYQSNCLGDSKACGYTKIALGGEPSFQTTVAALETTGRDGTARIGLISSVYFRSLYWTDPAWLGTTFNHNFDSQNAFTYGAGEAYFAYIDRDTSNHAEVVRVAIESGADVTQLVSAPIRVDVYGGAQDVKLTYLNQNHSVITYVVPDYRNLQIWRAELSTQFDVVGTSLVAYSATSKDLAEGTYRTHRISDNSLELMVPTVDSRFPESWQLDKVSLNVFDPDSDVTTLAKGNDIENNVQLGGSFTSYNNAYALAINSKPVSKLLRSTSVYQSDFGLVPIPIKTRGAELIDQTIFADQYNNTIWNVNNVRKGAFQYLEQTKVQIKLGPKLALYGATYSNNLVGGFVSTSLIEWSSMQDTQATGAVWISCKKRITQTTTGIPKFCKAIYGQSGPSYSPTEADRGKFITVAVTAKNRYGSSVVSLPSTKAIH